MGQAEAVDPHWLYGEGGSSPGRCPRDWLGVDDVLLEERKVLLGHIPAVLGLCVCVCESACMCALAYIMARE